MLQLLLLSHFSRVRLCATPDGSPPGSPVPGILQARTLGCHFLLQCMKVKSESEVAQSCPIPSNPVDCSLPGSSIHGFSRQEYWSGLPLPSPNGILLSHKKEQNFTTCSNMDGLGGHDAQRNKSVRKRQILYDVIYVESKK